MKSILKEFAYGNINPNNGTIVKGTRYESLIQTIATSEATLITLIDNEDTKALLNKLSSAQLEANAISNTDKFIDGYRLGVLMTIEVFKGDENSSYNTGGAIYE